MNNKMKSPFRAFFLGLIMPGAGHIYVGKSIMGACFFLVVGLCGAGGLAYVLNPSAKVHPYFVVPLVFAACCYLFSVFHAFYSANRYNRINGLTGTISARTRAGIIVGMLLVLAAYFFLVRFLSQDLFTTFTVPPDSMEPTLYSGERVLVNLMTYKVEPPKRGDIVIYRHPQDAARTSMHRIIAFPGEAVELKDHKIFVNGSQLKDEWAVKVRHYNGGKLARKGMKPFPVEPGTYYVLGDNAARSEDSRVWGCLPAKNVIGKVHKIISPYDRSGRVE